MDSLALLQQHALELQTEFDRIYLEIQYDEVLYGTEANDTLSGGSGNDYFQGEANNDLLEGNAGNDVIFGQAGNDSLLGGEGNDYLSGVSYGSLYDSTEADFEESLIDSIVSEQLNLASVETALYTEIDILVGGAGADNFVLGDAAGVHYYDYYNYNNLDYSYAAIADFNPLENDTIQVYGDLADYSLSNLDSNGDGTIDTLISYQNDVVAVVANNTNLNTDNFTVVEPEANSTGIVDFLIDPFYSIDLVGGIYDSTASISELGIETNLQ